MLTFMFRSFDQFTDHCLYDAYVAIEQSTKDTASEGDPEIGRKADYEQGRDGGSLW